jgi:epoxyqueuosine reductase
MSLTQDIKEFALDLGYSRVGITSAAAFPGYITELEAREEMYGFYTNRPNSPLKGAEPKSLMPSAKSIVMVVFDAFKESFPEKLVGRVGRIYQARCYQPPPHRINGARYKLMCDFLESNGCRVDSEIRVPERLAACRAGTVTYGKNGFAFADPIGSFIIISAFVIDKELDYDEPTHEVKCPPNCTLCIDACPTGALYEPMKIDPRRCIAFNHWTTQDDDGSNPAAVGSYIPPEIREKMGGWIHGCDICQEVCPRNQKKLKAQLPRDEFLERISGDFEITKLLNLSDEFFVKRVRPIMYNYIHEKKYFQRNAAIALGNSRDPAFIPDLARAMQDEEGMVRGYAAWALGMIGGDRAREILESRLSVETDEFARTEIRSALKAF